jgi:1-aminocyclopropane-1-carboxylate deaminase/D-cysteine desulfhydrase-like pyridoxal-dependent ACC family enzyme
MSAPIVMVDEVRIWPNAKGIFRKGSAHLTVDGTTPEHLEALHAFAKRLGLRREWFQDHKLAPHYDLVPARHAAALDAGAELVDAYEQARRRIDARRVAGIVAASPRS